MPTKKTKRIFRDEETGEFTNEEKGEPERVPVVQEIVDEWDDFLEYEDYDGYEFEFHATGDTGKKK